MYGEFKELQSLTGDGRLLVWAEAVFDGQVVMVVVDLEMLDTQEKTLVSDCRVIDSAMADGRATVGSDVWGTVPVQGSLQL